MALFLLIDTALETGIVSIANEVGVIDVLYNNEQQQHASWLHTSIQDIFRKNNLDLKNIDALSVTIGPGSYTGLRIGLSTAKGLAYALQKPLITINNLHLIALANENNYTDFYIPMIDARRNEVFTSVYDKNFTILKDSHSLVLNDQCFNIELSSKTLLFCGNGAKKFENILTHPNALFQYVEYDIKQFYILTINSFINNKFANIVHTTPNYGKEFYITDK